MNHETAALNQRLDDLTASLGQALEALTARVEALEAREEQGATFRCQDHARLLTLERLAANPPSLRGAPADPGGPPPQILTRNHYRAHAVRRFAALDGIEFILSINGQERARLQLPTRQFHELVADLGMRPTTPSATEYESGTLSETPAGRSLARENAILRSTIRALGEEVNALAAHSGADDCPCSACRRDPNG